MVLFRSLAVCLAATLAHCQTSTRLITATTTVTASESGACENFVGACVVYGTAGAMPSTTTVYTGSPASTSTTTATTTVYTSYSGSSPTATATGACGNFVGACVVYATNTQGGSTYSTTVYSGSTHTSGSDGNQAIGSTTQGQGFIGAAAAPYPSMWTIIPIISLAFVNLGFVLLV